MRLCGDHTLEQVSMHVFVRTESIVLLSVEAAGIIHLVCTLIVSLVCTQQQHTVLH